MTMLTLKKKDFWEIVINNYINGNIASQIANYEQDAAEVIKIIKKNINDDLFKNVENTDEFLKI